MDKVKIELSPCDAVAILAVITEVNKLVNQQPITKAIKNYEKQLYLSMTEAQIEAVT